MACTRFFDLDLESTDKPDLMAAALGPPMNFRLNVSCFLGVSGFLDSKEALPLESIESYRALACVPPDLPHRLVIIGRLHKQIVSKDNFHRWTGYANMGFLNLETRRASPCKATLQISNVLHPGHIP